MSFITICGDCPTKPKQRYDRGVCKPVKKQAGSLRAFFAHCGVTFTDIFDTSAAGEWATKVAGANPDILATPSYTLFDVQEPSSNVLLNVGPSMDIHDLHDYTFQMTTATVSATYDDTEDFFFDLYDKHASLLLNWADYTGGRLYTDNDTVEAFRAGSSPLAITDSLGFAFTMSHPRFIPTNGPGRAGVWRVTGAFSTAHMVRSIEIPGFKSVIDDNA